MDVEVGKLNNKCQVLTQWNTTLEEDKRNLVNQVSGRGPGSRRDPVSSPLEDPQRLIVDCRWRCCWRSTTSCWARRWRRRITSTRRPRTFQISSTTSSARKRSSRTRSWNSTAAWRTPPPRRWRRSRRPESAPSSSARCGAPPRSSSNRCPDPDPDPAATWAATATALTTRIPSAWNQDPIQDPIPAAGPWMEAVVGRAIWRRRGGASANASASRCPSSATTTKRRSFAAASRRMRCLPAGSSSATPIPSARRRWNRRCSTATALRRAP